MSKINRLDTNSPIQIYHLNTAKKASDAAKATPEESNRIGEDQVLQTAKNCQICGHIEAYEQLRFGVEAVLCMRCQTRLNIIDIVQLLVWGALGLSVASMLLSAFAPKESPITEFGPQIYYVNFSLAMVTTLLTLGSFYRKREFMVLPFVACMMITGVITMFFMISYQRDHPYILNDPASLIAYNTENYNPAVNVANAKLGFAIILTALFVAGTNLLGKMNYLANAHFIDRFYLDIKRVEVHIAIKRLGEDATFVATLDFRMINHNKSLVRNITRNITIQADKLEFVEIQILRLALRRLKSRLYQRPASYDLEIYGCTINLYDLEQQAPHTHSLEAAQYLDQIHDLLKSFPIVQWVAADQAGQQTHSIPAEDVLN